MFFSNSHQSFPLPLCLNLSQRDDLPEGRNCVGLMHLLFSLCLGQCLVLRMCSTNNCWMDRWMDEWILFPISITSRGEESLWAEQNEGIGSPEKRAGDKQNSNKKSLTFTEYLLCTRHAKDTMHTWSHLILTEAKQSKDYFFNQWLLCSYCVPGTWWGTRNTE